jgi:hypothetical protein
VFIFRPFEIIEPSPPANNFIFSHPGQWLPEKCFFLFRCFLHLKKPLSARYARTPRTQGQDEFFKKNEAHFYFYCLNFFQKNLALLPRAKWLPKRFLRGLCAFWLFNIICKVGKNIRLFFAALYFLFLF